MCHVIGAGVSVQYHTFHIFISQKGVEFAPLLLLKTDRKSYGDSKCVIRYDVDML